MRSSLYAFDCRGSGPYPRHENPDDSNLSASRLASILLTIPGSLAASAASVKATTHETLPPSGAATVTVAKMGLPSPSAVATTALPPSRRTRPCINSRRRVRPVAIVLYDTACRFGPGAAHMCFGWSLRRFCQGAMRPSESAGVEGPAAPASAAAAFDRAVFELSVSGYSGCRSTNLVSRWMWH